MTLELQQPARNPLNGCASVISPSAPPGSGPPLTQRAAIILALSQSTVALAVVVATHSAAHLPLAATVFGAVTFFNRIVG
jgi:hypothetical protein